MSHAVEKLPVKFTPMLKIVNKWIAEVSDPRADIVDTKYDAFCAGVLYSAKVAEAINTDRAGKLDKFQIADALRALVAEMEVDLS